MEWADRCRELLPERSVRVEVSIVDEQRRRISVSGTHPRALEIIESLSREVFED
jgi:tRNA A37 threonylcarbamoyladenosine biosynthesis protein TsaE